MYKIHVPTTKGIKLETVYNVADFPYEDIKDCKRCSTKTVINGEKAVVNYYNVSAAFDIESTTIEPEKDIEGNYIENPYGFMYHWQACIKGNVVFGRHWEDFILFLQKLRSHLNLGTTYRLVIYVHNLPYEFQFMKDFIQIDSIFAKDKRKPIKVVSDGIEFRCSYSLSNRSLDSFCENSHLCTHHKLSGDFDYNKIRTCNTELTELELGYCYNDVAGLCECIDTLLEEDTITTIPLTNTGYVRREFRDAMRNNKLHKEFMKARINAHEYEMLRRCFRGGNTHANRYLAGQILENVYSFDISSSYPSSIAMDYFPMDKFTAVTLDSQAKLDYYTSRYCVVLDVSFYNITLKERKPVPYIDIAHCYRSSNIKNDNGRVLAADFIQLTITNIDLDIIRSMYDYDGLVVNEAMYAERGKLPVELRNKMMEFYIAKTQLKGVEDREYDYMKSKNRLNSTFGMMVTDLAHSVVEYNTETMEWSENQPDTESALNDFFQNRNNFLWYQWGVFVTANARKRLQDMIDKVGMDVVYTDTDSIKFINKEHIAQFEAMNEIRVQQAETNDIPAYCDRDGERYYLGTWDNDGNYDRFKTLGAKKYAYDITKKGKQSLHVTVSGMSKTKGAEAIGCLENFEITGKPLKNVGRTTSWYNDEKPHEITINNATFLTASNIGILESTYTLGITNEYYELLCETGAITSGLQEIF